MTTLSKPAWLRKRLPAQSALPATRELLDGLGLDTVCREARCPNIWECWSRGTATFLILGPRCARHCGFCSVAPGLPSSVDASEPQRVARAVAAMGLEHVVVTSVTRDDLPDGGAAQFARVIEHVKRARPQARIEVLIPDLQGSAAALQTVVSANPDVIAHNVETVPRLYPQVRPQADYRRSLALLKKVGLMDSSVLVKSGFMLGLGETADEVLALMRDLKESGCRILTVGQYLRPSAEQLPVHEYVTPETFEEYAGAARGLGFRHVASGPFVRSSYDAGAIWRAEIK